MGANFGDTIAVPLDFSGYFGEKANVKLFALMVAGLDSVNVNIESQTISYGTDSIPLEVFGIDPEDMIVYLNYTLAATYDNPDGKFSLIFSESAIIDCHYIFDQFITSCEAKLDVIKDKDPEIYKLAIEIINKLKNWLDNNDVTFCNYAYDINGVLKD